MLLEAQLSSIFFGKEEKEERKSVSTASHLSNALSSMNVYGKGNAINRVKK